MFLTERLEHPLWCPTPESIKTTNLYAFMQHFGFDATIPQSVRQFHQWSITHPQLFWHAVTQALKIQYKTPPHTTLDLQQGTEHPIWLADATLNIVDSCFKAPATQPALYYLNDQQTITSLTYGELEHLVNRVANSLTFAGYLPGDVIAIVMPMHVEAVAIYLGIIKMGGVVVSIAESFSSAEILARLDVAKARAIFIQDETHWAGHTLPLYAKMNHPMAPPAIVISGADEKKARLRNQDQYWEQFLVASNQRVSHPRAPSDACHILFSSGTSGTPKAIPWNHTTPIKVASDAYFYQNIQPEDVLAWPTSLGWMMGPWLVFAALMNQAAIALYTESPKERAFGEFIAKTRVTMLGVVPTLVASWHATQCMAGLDWQAIKVFSSSGECSNYADMHYLMTLAGNKPIIEYCGGTEIGGAYLTSTVIQANYPTLFSTATFGTHVIIIDAEGHEAKRGEVAIIPPAMGLSTVLLNALHHDTYFAGMPQTAAGEIMRRHGDEVLQRNDGYYAVLGRVDDTMNLGGIKISAVEIERALAGLTHIKELAAIAVSPQSQGLTQLIIFAVADQPSLDAIDTKKKMQAMINHALNPFFKIHDVIFLETLPRTASNKIMRRLLRDQYLAKGFN